VHWINGWVKLNERDVELWQNIVSYKVVESARTKHTFFKVVAMMSRRRVHWETTTDFLLAGLFCYVR